MIRPSSLGLGITGPHTTPLIPADQTQALIQAALDAGITLFDTGPAYGQGEGETRLGKALGSQRPAALISTKAGITEHRERDFSADGIEASLVRSLERLGTCYVDWLWLHGPSSDELTNPALLARLADLKSRAMIRHVGVCGRGRELDTALETDAIEGIMAPFHAGLDTRQRARLRAAHNAGLFVAGIEVMAGARRGHTNPLRPADLWTLARRIKHRLTGLSSPPLDITPAQALEFALDAQEIDCALTMTSRIPHMQANARLAGLVGPGATT